MIFDIACKSTFKAVSNIKSTFYGGYHMRLFVLSIICSAIFISGCASSQTPVKGVAGEIFEGTWESYPTGKIPLINKVIFLPDHRCRVSIIRNGKITYENYDNCSYKISHDSAIITVIDYPKKSDSNWQNSVSTSQITPINNGRLLDYRLLVTFIKYKDGKQKIIKAWKPYGKQAKTDKTPGGGHFILHRVTSLNDVFSKLHSKL
jgi:hypothetical protein